MAVEQRAGILNIVSALSNQFLHALQKSPNDQIFQSPNVAIYTRKLIKIRQVSERGTQQINPSWLTRFDSRFYEEHPPLTEARLRSPYHPDNRVYCGFSIAIYADHIEVVEYGLAKDGEPRIFYMVNHRRYGTEVYREGDGGLNLNSAPGEPYRPTDKWKVKRLFKRALARPGGDHKKVLEAYSTITTL